MKLGFVGGGVMAEAIVAGVLKQGVAQAGEIVVSDVLEVRRQYMTRTHGVRAVAENAQAVAGADLVVLAIKPQQLAVVAAGLKGQIGASQAVVSIIAGATLKSLTSGLGHEAVIRVMPNTPGQVGAGISAWMAAPKVTGQQAAAAQQVLRALGEEVQVSDEKMLDIATAISGSGPAYVFLFIEALTDAGVYLGMARDVALKLAVYTVAGSGQMAAVTKEHPGILRERVTSPGGTTAEALLALEDDGFRAAVMNAVVVAYEKSKELGKT